ncbi:MAG: VCBS repeat-containing protein [Candidatus Omnitrophota bacterium]|nr:MAG: VCBS repeat-containing protein [Candidatus Omnitrophota bacterium]
MKSYKLISGIILTLVALIVIALPLLSVAPPVKEKKITIREKWQHFSSKEGRISVPNEGKEQVASLILDIDKDGIDDFVIAERTRIPSVVWYKYKNGSWKKYVIDNTPLSIEAGGAFTDIDGDRDLDIVFGADWKDNKVWWWENPYPNYQPNISWVRRTIKAGGAKKHHDEIFGDFDGDRKEELVFWNQDAKKLFIADIPSNPRNIKEWEYADIYSYRDREHEGLAKFDIDKDGKIDIVGGGHWFKHIKGKKYKANLIDGEQVFSRAAAGQLKRGGWAEVVFVIGDGKGPLKWYEYKRNRWIGHTLLNGVDHGHSLQLVDFNDDGHLDIFCAEMRLNSKNEDAKMWVLLGDGKGNFEKIVIATGYGNHESRIGDLSGDGKLDILSKPYNWETPRIDIWLSEKQEQVRLDVWGRQVIDKTKPWRSVFVFFADIDADNKKDIITGGWWYKNPGSCGGDWIRHDIGSPLNNAAIVYDFDDDGDKDILGTDGKVYGNRFVWARNDGKGSFSILKNIERGSGDFLQGTVIGSFDNGKRPQIVLSWHKAGKGLQLLEVPLNPSNELWRIRKITSVSQDEGLSAGDIDNDGDKDLLLGTKWLRNDKNAWRTFTIYHGSEPPDRNRLADINNDGKLDAIVGFEAINRAGKIAWYEQRDAISDWQEHIIDRIIGPMSLDVADMDADGDLDVIVGEHNLRNPKRAKLYIYENDGRGENWKKHIVYIGDEHHDGAQSIDIDGDGDLDIVSIGWGHDRVIIYENRAINVKE